MHRPSLAALWVPRGAELTVCKAPRSLSSACTGARRMVGEIPRDLAPVEDEVRNAPFLDDLAVGSATLHQVADLLAEQYNIIRSDQGSFSETIALDLLLDLAAHLGPTKEELAAYEPRPKAQTYPSRVAWIALYADRASSGASSIVSGSVGRVRRAPIHVYGATVSKHGALPL